MAYRKSIRTLNKERKREWSRRAVAAKERKRMEFGSTLHDCGGFTTDGIFGSHSIRVLSYGDGVRHYAITVDGEHRQARTERGILRCVAQMIFKKVSQKDMP